MNVSLALGPSTVFALIVLAAFLIFFFVAWSNSEQGRSPNLRALRPLTRLRGLIGQSAESGGGCITRREAAVSTTSRALPKL